MNNVEKSRNKYKPAKIKLLLVAEAPPKSVEHFFYFENVDSRDFLYIGVIKAILGSCENIKLIRRKKKEILNLLKKYGVYLMDLSPEPIDGFKAEKYKDNFLAVLKAEKCIDKLTCLVILIKVNVYDCLFCSLKNNNYNVIDKRICFPSCGRQKQFHTSFIEALSHYPSINELKEDILSLLE